MKISLRLTTMIRRSMHRKDGITVIEVLTSLVVATIGVFGVLVLIPFAVKQSQLGLDQDAARVLAENAIQDMQIYGFTRVGNDGSLQLRGARVDIDPSTGNTVPPAYPVPAFNAVLPQPDPGGEISRLRLGTYAIPLYIGGSLIDPTTGDPVIDPITTDQIPNPPQVIHFDPAAVAQIGFPVLPGTVVNPDYLTSQIPLLSGRDSDNTQRPLNQLRVTVATASSGGTFSFGGGTYNDILRGPELAKIFRSFDDQTYSDVNFQSTKVADTELPQPIFDFSSAGNLVKRQSLGRLSWSALLVPQKNESVINILKPTPAPEHLTESTIATNYKAYVMVYGDRSLTPISVAQTALANYEAIGDTNLPVPIQTESLMQAAEVFRRPTDTLIPNAHGGFEAEVNRIVLAPGVTSRGVFKDDWIMLINRRPLADYSVVPAQASTLPVPIRSAGGVTPLRLNADEEGYRIQIGFAKVLSVGTTGANTVLSVEGGPFDFYYSDVHGGSFGGMFDPTDSGYTSSTYVIHLKNVLNVYERTISLERDSIWN